ncbi:MAG: glycoside hydrolase family 3 C-terminal domain-containing protein [Lentisphaeria bacterium]|nr:glycoside hydrolase family 3 C-terminal domain-containing protein [Lentisphaeria bacterium]
MEKFIREVLSRMTTEEKIQLTVGSGELSIGNLPSQGIREVYVADGPQGIRRESGEFNVALPCGLSLAASFDPKLAEEYGAVIGEEARACCIRGSLGPGMNLTRTPLNGRTFEYYGEDPIVSGKIAAGYVRGCQSKDVGACPKHLALNNQEICRTTGNSICDEATIRSLYLENFETMLRESEPWMVMSAYNKINGVQASECELTQKKFLRGEFNFDGVIMSDWGGTWNRAKALNGGQDLEMPGRPREKVLEDLLAKVESGELSMEVLDNAVLNNLRLLYRMKAFEKDEDTGGYEVNSKKNIDFVRHCAAEGAVLLKNDDKFLPVDFKKLKKIAVIGPSADYKHQFDKPLDLGGGSGAVHPAYEVTVLEAIKKQFGENCEVKYASGVKFSLEKAIDPELLGDGFTAEYYNSYQDLEDGKEPFLTRKEKTMQLRFGVLNAGGVMTSDEIADAKAARFKGYITPKKSGKVHIQFGTIQFFSRFFVNGKEYTDPQRFINGKYGFETPICEMDAVAGEPIEIELIIKRLSKTLAKVNLRYTECDNAAIDNAVEVAKNADLVVYVGGTHHIYDREGLGWGDAKDVDIPDLELPDNQVGLIKEILKVNKKMAVVLINGSVVNIEDFADEVPAILEVFYPGMECGNSVVDMLSGAKTPNGRLPFTWCRKLTDYPSIANGNYPGNRTAEVPYVHYDEGVFIGYRYTEREKIDVRFPFGYGLSYAEFEHELLEMSDNGETCKVRVKNISDCDGASVVQLYVGCKDNLPVRPEKVLRNFVKVHLKAGEEKIIELALTERDFSYFNADSFKFESCKGEFFIELGTNIKDIFARKTINR